FALDLGPGFATVAGAAVGIGLGLLGAGRRGGGGLGLGRGCRQPMPLWTGKRRYVVPRRQIGGGQTTGAFFRGHLGLGLRAHLWPATHWRIWVSTLLPGARRVAKEPPGSAGRSCQGRRASRSKGSAGTSGLSTSTNRSCSLKRFI